MKHLIITISAALFLATCGTEPKSQEGCEEGCKKENCEHEKGEKSCAAECKKDCCSNEETKLKIGDTNPALENKLMDVSGEEIYIEELGKKNGTLLIFSCNTCPFVVGNGEKSQGWENRYNDIQAMATKLEIGFALINSNEAKRSGEDSFDNMILHAKERGYNGIKYLVDSKHAVADAYSAITTPHVYLFNANNELVYTGAIDDNVDSKEEVKEHWLADAMKELAEGKEITKPITKNMGCSIKRVKKEDAHHGHDH